MKTKTRLTVEIDSKQRQKLKVIAAKHNKSMKQFIIDYINELRG